MNGLTLSHRPKYSMIPVLAQNFHLAVMLLKESEGAHKLIDLYNQYGLKYLWVPFTVGLAHKAPLTREETVHVRVAADMVAAQLRQGQRVFVHCSAGVHRTGTFAYAVLRRMGYDRDTTLSLIRHIRPVTADGMRPFIHWAEDVLVDQLHSDVRVDSDGTFTEDDQGNWHEVSGPVVLPTVLGFEA